MLAVNQSKDEAFTCLFKSLQIARQNRDNRAVAIGGPAFYKHAFLCYSTVIQSTLNVAQESVRDQECSRKPDNGAVAMHGAAFYKHAILCYGTVI